MKKTFIHIICLVAAMLFLSGCSDNKEIYEAREFCSDGTEINAVNVDVHDRRIELSLSEDKQVRIEYFESDKEYYDIFVSDDGVLNVVSASDKELKDYVGTKTAKENRKILIKLPGKMLDSMSLATTNEDIVLLPVAADSVSLYANGGDILFEELNAEKEIILNVKNGSIEGTVVGGYDEYAISCEIKKGDSNLPELKEGGEKSLVVTANNGDVNIKLGD